MSIQYGLTDAERKVYACGDKSKPVNIMSHFGKLTEKAFKRVATAYDFKVCAAILELIKDLPGSHGMTSVSKILRGKAKTCTKNPNFGMCEGMKEYPQTKLFKLAEDIELWMLINGLCSDKSNMLEWDQSDPIYTRKKADALLSILIIQLLRDHADKFGVAAQVPKKIAELDFKKFKVPFMEWMQKNLLADIKKLTVDNTFAGNYRAHKHYPLRNHPQLGTYAEYDVCDTINLMNADRLPVFNLSKSRLKDGTFRVTAIVSGALIPVNWVSKSYQSQVINRDSKLSELDEACGGDIWFEGSYSGFKPVAMSVRVKAVVDSDGKILSHEVILAPGFCMDNMSGGGKNWPDYIVDTKSVTKLW